MQASLKLYLKDRQEMNRFDTCEMYISYKELLLSFAKIYFGRPGNLFGLYWKNDLCEAVRALPDE